MQMLMEYVDQINSRPPLSSLQDVIQLIVGCTLWLQELYTIIHHGACNIGGKPQILLHYN